MLSRLKGKGKDLAILTYGRWPSLAPCRSRSPDLDRYVTLSRLKGGETLDMFGIWRARTTALCCAVTVEGKPPRMRGFKPRLPVMLRCAVSVEGKENGKDQAILTYGRWPSLSPCRSRSPDLDRCVALSRLKGWETLDMFGIWRSRTTALCCAGPVEGKPPP